MTGVVIPSPPASHAPLSRYACERCRCHKLRCIRNGSSSSSCVRCERAGASCTTSPRLRIGRPSRKDVQRRPREEAHSPRSPSVTLTPASTSTSISTAASISSLTSSASTRSSVSTPLSGPATDALDFAWLAPDPLDIDSRRLSGNAVDAAMDASAIQAVNPDSTDLAFANALGNEESHEGLLADDASPVPWQFNAYTDHVSYTPLPHVTGFPEPHPSAQLADGHGTQCGKEDAILQVFSLNQRMYRQFRRLDNSDGTDLFSSTRGQYEEGGQAKGEKSQIGEILKMSEEFLQILNGIFQCSREAGDPAAGCAEIRRGSSTGNHTEHGCTKNSPDPPLTLQIIGCYLQLVRIYCTVFSRVRQLVAASPFTSSCPAPLALPGLEISGFPLQSGILQTTILLQAVMHLLGQIEEVLGIPMEHCVCGVEEQPNGMLSDVDSTDLFIAVLRQEERSSCTSNKGSLKVLKEHIKSIRYSLNKRGLL